MFLLKKEYGILVLDGIDIFLKPQLKKASGKINFKFLGKTIFSKEAQSEIFI